MLIEFLTRFTFLVQEISWWSEIAESIISNGKSRFFENVVNNRALQTHHVYSTLKRRGMTVSKSFQYGIHTWYVCREELLHVINCSKAVWLIWTAWINVITLALDRTFKILSKAFQTLSRAFEPLRIFTGKKHPQVKLKLFQEVWIWAFGWLVYTSNQLFIQGSKTKTKFSKI